MQVQVDSVSDIKQGQYGVSSKMKSGSDTFYANEDATKYIGKTVEFEVEEKTSGKGNRYKIAKNIKILEAGKAANDNGHIPWANYEAMAKVAHGLARQLEPDLVGIEPNGDGEGKSVIKVDRSPARAALVNTVMIAFTNGKIALTEGEDDIPF